MRPFTKKNMKIPPVLMIQEWAIMPSKYTDEIENASDTWRVFLYGKKIKIFTPAKVNYYQ